MHTLPFIHIENANTIFYFQVTMEQVKTESEDNIHLKNMCSVNQQNEIEVKSEVNPLTFVDCVLNAESQVTN